MLHAQSATQAGQRFRTGRAFHNQSNTAVWTDYAT
jgi:hypothetical protein